MKIKILEIFVFWKIPYSATIRDKHFISFSTGSKYPMPNMYCKKMKFLTPLGVLGPVNHKNDQNWASNISDPLLLGFCGNFKPYLLLNMWFSNEIMQNYHPGPSQRISLIDINFLKSVVDGTKASWTGQYLKCAISGHMDSRNFSNLSKSMHLHSLLNATLSIFTLL